MGVNNQELTHLVQQISLEFFKRPFLHRALFNKRLKTTGGRFHLNDHHIDINPLLLNVDKAILYGVIKHELCHYHLHLEGKGYRHADQDFKKLLQAVGGLRYTPRLQQPKFHYQCIVCQQDYFRIRRLNVRKYACGKCAGRLKLVKDY